VAGFEQETKLFVKGEKERPRPGGQGGDERWGKAKKIASAELHRKSGKANYFRLRKKKGRFLRTYKEKRKWMTEK